MQTSVKRLHCAANHTRSKFCARRWSCEHHMIVHPQINTSGRQLQPHEKESSHDVCPAKLAASRTIPAIITTIGIASVAIVTTIGIAIVAIVTTVPTIVAIVTTVELFVQRLLS